MKPVVVRNIQRADTNAIATFEALGVSTAHEALGRSGLMKPYMRPIWAGASIAGPAVTILAQPGDNWMIHVAVEQCQTGRRRRARLHRRQYRRHVRRTARHLAEGARREGPDHRRRLPRREGAARRWASRSGRARFRPRARSRRRWARSTFRWSAPASMSSRATWWWPTTTASWSCRRRYAVETAQKAQKRFDDEDAKRKQLASGVLGLDMYNMREPLAKAGLRLRRQSGRRVAAGLFSPHTPCAGPQPSARAHLRAPG